MIFESKLVSPMNIRLIPISLYEGGEGEYMLHIHENTVRRWSNRGVLIAYRFGMRGDRRFYKEEVESLIAKLNKKR